MLFGWPPFLPPPWAVPLPEFPFFVFCAARRRLLKPPAENPVFSGNLHWFSLFFPPRRGPFSKNQGRLFSITYSVIPAFAKKVGSFSRSTIFLPLPWSFEAFFSFALLFHESRDLSRPPEFSFPLRARGTCDIFLATFVPPSLAKLFKSLSLSAPCLFPGGTFFPLASPFPFRPAP